jgi:hypothetical protein
MFFRLGSELDLLMMAKLLRFDTPVTTKNTMRIRSRFQWIIAAFYISLHRLQR